MTWRGSNTIPDRIFAALPYILPLLEVYIFGLFLFALFPSLQAIYLPLTPFLLLYGAIATVIPYPSLVIFFALFFLVVRNERIKHFIRFHTMQALLVSIFISILSAILEVLGFVQRGVNTQLPGSWFWGILSSAIFLATFAVAIYSIIQAFRGLYAEIPMISEAAYSQTR